MKDDSGSKSMSADQHSQSLVAKALVPDVVQDGTNRREDIDSFTMPD